MSDLVVFSQEVSRRRSKARAQSSLSRRRSSRTASRPPVGVEVGLESERRVRDAGAVPATIGVLDGRIRIGLEEGELERFTPEARKCGARDLATAAVQGTLGATTVGGTLAAARFAGIRFLGTGGLGGVHRGLPSPPDVSSDLSRARKNEAVVVCSGVKSLLDVPATVEVLETLGVPVLGWRTDTLPLFYSAARRPARLGAASRPPTRRRGSRARTSRYGGGPALLIGRPPDESLEVEELIEEAVAEARARGIVGGAVTPFVLANLHERSDGRTLAVNRELIVGQRRARRRDRRRVARMVDLLALPLVVERYELERSRTPSPPASRAGRPCPPPWRRRGGLGEDVTYVEDDQLAFQAAGPVLDLAGEQTLESFSARLPADLYEIPPLGVRERRARPRAAPGRPLARGRGRPRPAAADVRRLARAGHRGVARASTRRCASSSTPRTTGRTRSSPSSLATGAVDIVDLKGHYRGTSSTRPRPRALPACRRGVSRGVDRGRLARRATRGRCSSRTRDRLTWDAPDPLGGRRGGAPVPAGTLNSQAVAVRHRAAAPRLPRLLREDGHRRSTAAASSSWGRAAARSSSSPRSSTPTAERRRAGRATTRAGRAPACRRAR